MALLGLRIDVCTLQGLRRGALPLLQALGRRQLRASFFPTLGPDRSGQAIWRVLRQRGFLGKMVRTRALGMYGLRTLLYGTLLPAPCIAARCGDVLRRADGEGHEVGIHAWDHVRWQDRLDRLQAETLGGDYDQAMEAYSAWVGKPPLATAAPGWITSELALEAAARRGFRYASDTRGRAPFRPLVQGKPLPLPQIPVTLPTLDEVLGRNGATADDYFAQVLGQLRPEAANVLCVHAESEGRAHLAALERFLDRVLSLGWRIVPLGDLLPSATAGLSPASVERGRLPGRASVVSVQGP